MVALSLYSVLLYVLCVCYGVVCMFAYVVNVGDDVRIVMLCCLCDVSMLLCVLCWYVGC